MSESSATASPTPSSSPSPSADGLTRRQLFATASGRLRLGPAYMPVEATPGTLNVGHGHVVPRPDSVRARRGGPSLCRERSRDLARQRTEGTVDVHVSGSVARVTIAADVHKLAEALRAAAEEAARVWPPRRPEAEAAGHPAPACLIHDTTGEGVRGWEMTDCTCPVRRIDPRDLLAEALAHPIDWAALLGTTDPQEGAPR